MSKANALENLLLDLVLGGVAYTPAANIWIALYGDIPTDATTPVELSVGSYARVMAANNLTTWEDAASGQKTNAIDIVFPQATADWGLVRGFAVHKHATNVDVLYWGAVVPPRTIVDGNIPKFEAGDLLVTED